MINWYLIANTSDIDSRSANTKIFYIDLGDDGIHEIEVVKSNHYDLFFEDVFLSAKLNSNPFFSQDDKYGLLIKEDGNMYLGFYHADSL